MTIGRRVLRLSWSRRNSCRRRLGRSWWRRLCLVKVTRCAGVKCVCVCVSLQEANARKRGTERRVSTARRLTCSPTQCPPPRSSHQGPRACRSHTVAVTPSPIPHPPAHSVWAPPLPSGHSVLNYTIGFLGSPACRWQTVGLLGSYSCPSQFL